MFLPLAGERMKVGMKLHYFRGRKRVICNYCGCEIVRNIKRVKKHLSRCKARKDKLGNEAQARTEDMEIESILSHGEGDSVKDIVQDLVNEVPIAKKQKLIGNYAISTSRTKKEC